METNDFKNNLGNFFNNILKTSVDNKLKKNIVLSENKLKSNILYLTTECNLNCDYCYQKEEREKLSRQTYISKENVNDFFKDLIEREPHNASTVVLFGGEPFLNNEIFFYILDLTDKITFYKHKQFNLSTTTNGMWFLNDKNFNFFVNRVQKLLNHFSLEVSYDVSGHDRRVYKNGKSTKDDVEKVLKKFCDINFPLTIRYTIHKDNYKNALNDLVFLSKNKNYKKIVVNFYEQELENYTDVNDLKEQLKRYANYIFEKTSKPICHLNCLSCMGCNFENFDGIYYRHNDKSFVINDNVEKFNGFTKTN